MLLKQLRHTKARTAREITYRFKNENLWVNPEPELTVGSMVRVYVEEGNYKNYYVDAERMIQGKIVDYT